MEVKIWDIIKVHEKCTKLLVQSAVRNVKYLSSLLKDELFTVKIVTLRETEAITKKQV